MYKGLGDDMARTRLIAALILTYVAFAMLLNSVGTVILQSISSFHVTKPEASTLEGFKDITIAIVSFVTASYLPRIGLKNALVGALVLAVAGCLVMPLFGSFDVARGKAIASVATGGVSGKDLMARYKENPIVFGQISSLSYGGPMFPSQGSLPIYLGGTLIGAVGASAASSQLDEDAGRAGLHAIGASEVRP